MTSRGTVTSAGQAKAKGLSAPVRVFQMLTFPPDLAPFVKWDSIATRARDIGGHFTAINRDDGAWIVTIFWDSAAERP